MNMPGDERLDELGVDRALRKDISVMTFQPGGCLRDAQGSCLGR